jgi:exodeoxyribonuclease I
MSYVFYDTETTGISTSFDQILQFAAIRTDPDLNELDRYEIRCRLLANVVPAPRAMLITGVSAVQLLDKALPSHYEMMCSIRKKLLEWTPSTFVGYNSIEFDEHLLRNSYYRTLHPPYLTNSLGNARSDVLRAVQAATLFTPGRIQVPLGSNHKPSFKLDKLAPANGFAHANAHDALGDVEATIFMARIISEKCPDVWSSFMRFSNKAAVADFVSNEQIFCLADFYFGKPYSWLVTPLRSDKIELQDIHVFDLGVDPYSLARLTDTELRGRLSASPKPVRRIRGNASPMIFAADDAPDATSGKRLPQAEIDRRIRCLEPNSELSLRILKCLQESKKESPELVHVEQQLYRGFFAPDDERLLLSFHNVEWSERPMLVRQLQDPRLRLLGQQLIHAEHPELMELESRREHDRAIAKRMVEKEPEGLWLTLPEALLEIDGLLDSSSTTDRLFLMEHRDQLSRRLDAALAILR